jgi:hypothetical protein
MLSEQHFANFKDGSSYFFQSFFASAIRVYRNKKLIISIAQK